PDGVPPLERSPRTRCAASPVRRRARCSRADLTRRPAHRPDAQTRQSPARRACGDCRVYSRVAGTYSSVAEPPAAVSFSRALPENLWAVTSSLTLTVPSPSTLTRVFLRTAPLATNSSIPTVPPAGNSRARSPTLTTAYSVRN